MADKQPEAPAPESAHKGGSHKLLIPIVALILILNLALVGRIFLAGGGGKQAAKPHKEAEEVGAKVTLEEFMANLAGSGDHYLKATFALGLKKGLTEEAIKEETPPIRDAILGVICSQTREGLATEEGRNRLKELIRERVNRALGGRKVVEVYFVSFTTQ